MVVADMAETSMGAPYDLLRALRCAGRRDGKDCGERAGMIDWSVPGQFRTWKCPVCKTANAVRIVEARQGA